LGVAGEWLGMSYTMRIVWALSVIAAVMWWLAIAGLRGRPSTTPTLGPGA
jgi:uncharacterized membrane protein